MSKSNRRRHSRVRAKAVAAHLQTDRGSTSCYVDNISEGGLFIRTSEVLPSGMAVSLTLVRPGMKKGLRLTGRVVNAFTPDEAMERGLSPGMGVQFDPLEPDCTERLLNLMRDLGVPQGGPAAPLAFAPEPAGEPPPEPQRPSPHSPPPAAPAAPQPAYDGDAKLLIQIRGLLHELGEAHDLLRAREREIADLRDELNRLKAELTWRDALLAKAGQSPKR
ncbi:MAG: PilZ domain-containing protein [Myxococcales bacterium]|nr:PilZ domain-containing protein [Myxococcales bacterium]